MEEKGVVVTAGPPGRALVRVTPSAACQGCAAGAACHGAGPRREAEVEVNDPLGVSPGQRVEISMPASSVLKASTGLFFLPFLVLILVGGITYPPLAAALGAKGARLASAALGVAGMILSHWLIRRAMAGKEGSSLRPTILRVVTDAPEGCGVVSPS